jgi:hypothetical protein
MAKVTWNSGDLVSADLYGGPVDGVVMWQVDGAVSYGGNPFYRVRKLRDRRTGHIMPISHSFTVEASQLTAWDGER